MSRSPLRGPTLQLMPRLIAGEHQACAGSQRTLFGCAKCCASMVLAGSRAALAAQCHLHARRRSKSHHSQPLRTTRTCMLSDRSDAGTVRPSASLNCAP